MTTRSGFKAELTKKVAAAAGAGSAGGMSSNMAPGGMSLGGVVKSDITTGSGGQRMERGEDKRKRESVSGTLVLV